MKPINLLLLDCSPRRDGIIGFKGVRFTHATGLASAEVPQSVIEALATQSLRSGALTA